MKEYLSKQKELETLAETKVNEIVTNLISECDGKTISELRRHTLDFIKQNQLPESISCKVKRKIDVYIEKMVVQEEKSPQVAGTTSGEKENHISCEFCLNRIHIDDNYCSFCGRANFQKTLAIIANHMKNVTKNL